MSQLRDISFLTKMMIADPHSVRESLRVQSRGVVRESWLKKAIIYPSSLLPTWEVTSGERSETRTPSLAPSALAGRCVPSDRGDMISEGWAV